MVEFSLNLPKTVFKTVNELISSTTDNIQQQEMVTGFPEQGKWNSLASCKIICCMNAGFKLCMQIFHYR